jgi:hypothetical protein
LNIQSFKKHKEVIEVDSFYMKADILIFVEADYVKNENVHLENFMFVHLLIQKKNFEDSYCMFRII